MSSEAKQLKLKALQLKKAGDMEGAKKYLAQARAIEFDNIQVEDLNDAGELKRLAVHLKNRGDLEGAKAALVKSKQIEAAGGGAVVGKALLSKEENGVGAGGATQPLPIDDDNNDAGKQSPSSSGANHIQNTETTHDDGDNELQEQLNPTEGPVTFDDEEMIDIETMSELQSMGMDMPTETNYQDRIKANKIKAVAAKRSGDMDAAKRFLVRSKQLEAAYVKLYSDENDVDEESDDDDEDYSLLDELKEDGGDDNASSSDLFGVEENNMLDLEDLDDFDSDILREMMEAGMQVPDPDNVFKQAQEKKVLAKSLHKEGNVAGAKAALVESKKLQAQAEKLAQMLEEANMDGGGGGEDGEDMEALMAMLEGGSEGVGGGRAKKSASNMAAVPASTAPPEPKKSAEEWKFEAVRCKKEGKLTEATKALQKYKQAVAEEAEQAEMEKRRQVIGEIKAEIDMAMEQTKRFSFYERFVDAHVGTAQLLFWRKYVSDCTEAVDAIENKGTGAVAISRTTNDGGMTILNDDLSFVGEHMDSDDQRVEMAILDVMQIKENKNLKKALRHQQKELEQKGGKTAPGLQHEKPNIRVDVTIQLPPSENESDDNIQLHFQPEPSDNNSNGGYNFNADSTFFLDLPRGRSKYAKTIRRRMERKRIKINVVLVPIVEEEKGLFGWKKSKEAPPPETLLGSIAIELKEFLRGRAVCGDFALMDSIGRNELGGIVRLGIRTGTPFEPDAIETEEDLAEGEPVEIKAYSAMTFAT